MPGDFFRRMRQEVVVVQAGPQSPGPVFVESFLSQQSQGLRLNAGNVRLQVQRRAQATQQRTARAVIQVRQQCAFPTGPQCRIGAADVRYGEQIKVIQVIGVAHGGGEFLDDLGVIDILALGRH